MGYVKLQGEKFSTCLHNTVGIPDEYIMPGKDWVPTIAHKEKTKKKSKSSIRVAKVHELIKAASSEGRFVSKEWLCTAVGCGSRSMAKALTELQNNHTVCGLIAVRKATNCGYFYRMAGKYWTNKIQRTHAYIRHEMARGIPVEKCCTCRASVNTEKHTCIDSVNGENQTCRASVNDEMCKPNCPSVSTDLCKPHGRVLKELYGSLYIHKEPPQSFFLQNGELPAYVNSQAGRYEKIICNEDVDDEALKGGFVQTKIRRVKNMTFKRTHEDGRPGDGTQGTCYSAAGCISRLSDMGPLSEYSEMITPLLNVAAAPATFSASIARSACRRIDSGIMTPVAVRKVVEYLVSKNIVQPMYTLIRDFDYYTNRCIEKIDYSELPGLSVHIDAMILGSPVSELQNTLLKARDRLTTSLNILLESDNAGMLAPSKIINTILFNSVDPLWAQLAALLDFASFPDATINTVVDYYADKLHDDIAKDKNVFELFRKHEQRRKLLGKTKLIDWFDVATHTRKYATDLRSSLNMNGLEHVALNAYCENIKEDTIVNVIPYSPTCILR